MPIQKRGVNFYVIYSIALVTTKIELPLPTDGSLNIPNKALCNGINDCEDSSDNSDEDHEMAGTVIISEENIPAFFMLR